MRVLSMTSAASFLLLRSSVEAAAFLPFLNQYSSLVLRTKGIRRSAVVRGLCCVHRWPFTYVRTPISFRWISTTALSLSSSSSSSSESLLTTLAPGLHESEQTIKKSRFVGYATHCTSWSEAQSILQDIRNDHPKSRHVCYAFVAGTNPVQERCGDDGEPTGTAGVPILGAIKGLHLSDTFVAVVRYFGGIKLGAGGLIRAYGGSARLVLQSSPTETLIPQTTLRIQVPMGDAGSLYDTVGKMNGLAEEETYLSDGTLQVSVVVDTDRVEELRERLMDSTRGAVEFI